MATQELTAPREDPAALGGTTWKGLVGRLNRSSVAKHFHAHEDVRWDEPEMRIDAADPRWELTENHPLGATTWYRSQPAAVRSRLGLQVWASAMKVGLQFENVLERGLLEWILVLPDGVPEAQYAYHEIAEETQHSLMFQEFVRRTEMRTPGMPRVILRIARRIPRLARTFPQLFFVFVLGGEDPADHMQRQALQMPLHPTLERVMRIHVTEEARHLSFARNYLRETVPQLSRARRLRLAVTTPVVLGIMARLMYMPPVPLVRAYGIPEEAMGEAYELSDIHRAWLADCYRKTRDLFVELGLVGPVTRRLWRRFGIWEAPRRNAAVAEPA